MVVVARVGVVRDAGLRGLVARVGGTGLLVGLQARLNRGGGEALMHTQNKSH